MKKTLPELALERPITVTMLVISVLGLGFIAFQRIPIEFLPKFDVPFISVFIPYPGATPEQVMNEVAIPAEGEFRTLSNLDRISTNSNSNGCSVLLLFEPEVDMGLATAEVRDRVERLKLDLPDTVDRVLIQRFNSGSVPILAFSVFREGDTEELAHLVRKFLEPRLTRIDGVADVQIFSDPPRDVLIEFDQTKLQQHNLALYQVVERLQNASLNTGLGRLVDGETRHFVRVEGEFTRPEQYGELIVGDPAIRLRDVANVGYKERQMEERYSIDGKGGALILVRKESEANAVALSESVLEEIEAIKQDPIFEGMDAFIFFNQGSLIMAALNNLFKAGQYGALLALCVLGLFLMRLRPTLLVAFAIPSAMITGLAVMFMMGMTLNLVTMIALIVAVGMLVDNAIVVIENIYRYKQLGHSPNEAAIKGANGVGLAITAATTTTLVVFVPMFYLDSGEMSRYMKQFAVPVAVSLAASLLIALTFIPLIASRITPREKTWLYRKIQENLARRGYGEHDRERLVGRFNQSFFGRMAIPFLMPLRATIFGYSWLLDRSLRWRLVTLLAVGLVIAYTGWAVLPNLNMQQMPTVDTREVNIQVQFQQNFDLAKATDEMDKITEALDDMRDELGVKNIWRRFTNRGGEINVYLYAANEYPSDDIPRYDTEEVLNILWQRLPERIPGGHLKFSIPDAGEGGQSRAISLRMVGDDINVLTRNALAFEAVLEEIEGISTVNVGIDQDAEEVQLRIDEPLAANAGVTPAVIAQTVDFALRGTRLPELKREGREVDVWAQFREEDRKDKSNLENVNILTPNAGLVPLNNLVDMRRADSPDSIRRINGKNYLTINAQTTEEDLGPVIERVRAAGAAFDLPVGYELQESDSMREIDKTLRNFFTALIMAVCLIYIVMAALFESFLLPLSILVSVSLAGVGVVWAMFLSGTSLDTIAFISMILLVGIVVNNGIVIVDHINQLRRQGLSRHDAIVQSGRDRFRPVMMTAITTILGVVPLVLPNNMESEVSFASMGWALIGGLTTGTVLTLLIVPVVYSIIDDIQYFAMNYAATLAQLVSGQRGKPSNEPEYVGK